MASQTRTDARFSTYSGAPSIQPSLAPTFSTTKTSPSSARNTTTSTQLSEKATAARLSPHDLYQNPASTASSTTVNSADPKTQDLKSWHTGFERMQDARLDKQRYVMNDSKSDEVKALALGAKLERALGRRMVGQDATFSPRKGVNSEKASLEVEVN